MIDNVVKFLAILNLLLEKKIAFAHTTHIPAASESII